MLAWPRAGVPCGGCGRLASPFAVLASITSGRMHEVGSGAALEGLAASATAAAGWGAGPGAPCEEGRGTSANQAIDSPRRRGRGAGVEDASGGAVARTLSSYGAAGGWGGEAGASMRGRGILPARSPLASRTACTRLGEKEAGSGVETGVAASAAVGSRAGAGGASMDGPESPAGGKAEQDDPCGRSVAGGGNFRTVIMILVRVSSLLTLNSSGRPPFGHRF